MIGIFVSWGLYLIFGIAFTRLAYLELLSREPHIVGHVQTLSEHPSEILIVVMI